VTDGVLLELRVGGPSDADPHELERDALILREELLTLDVDSVEPSRSGPAPPGSKAVDAASFDVLAVALKQSIPLLTSVLGVVQAWLSGESSRSAAIRVGGDEIELRGLSRSQMERVVDSVIRDRSKRPVR
jgi:hypothetical protein